MVILRLSNRGGTGGGGSCQGTIGIIVALIQTDPGVISIFNNKLVSGVSEELGPFLGTKIRETIYRRRDCCAPVIRNNMLISHDGSGSWIEQKGNGTCVPLAKSNK
jgi:hypothetical protein